MPLPDLQPVLSRRSVQLFVREIGVLIYEGRNIRVRFRAAKRRRADCIVAAFHGRLPSPGYQTDNFGETFLAAEGYDAVHFQTDRNNWYQSVDIGRALEGAARVMARYPMRATYGSSMGGFAAVAFSGPLDATTVAAFVPQASARTATAPWESRWRDERDHIVPVMDDLATQVARGAKIFVAYDPMQRLDRRHVRRIEEIAPVERLQFPLSEHATLRFIADIGLHKRIPLDCFTGTADHMRYRATVRDLRRLSPTYLFYAGHYVRRLRKDTALCWRLWLAALDLPKGDTTFYKSIFRNAPPVGVIDEIERIVRRRRENTALQSAYSESPPARPA